MVPLEKILVAISNPEHLEELIAIAGTMAVGSEGAKVHILHVVTVPGSLSSEEGVWEELKQGEAMLHKAQGIARERFGLEVTTRLVRAREAGPAILEEATVKGVDVIILGYSQRRRFGDRFFGATTVDYISRYAPCRVLISVMSSKVKEG
ncbi:MAG: universal stress protein [candidate division NC10 bacterium]|nr:universal stress protein [candidate division NC10 bacterium]